MNKPIFNLTAVNTDYGAPMGRREYGLGHLLFRSPLYYAEVPLDDGYDAGGAYWGHGDPLFVVFAEVPEVCAFFRSPSLAAFLETYKADYPRSEIIPSESDTYALWADAMGYDIVSHFDGYQWKARFEAVESGEFPTMQECYEHLQDYTLGLDDVD